jgi:transcriptional regulator
MTLYLPRHFVESDPDSIRRVLDGFPFATLISVVDGQPILSHVPILIEYAAAGQPQRAIGHLAAANPHAAQLGAGGALLVFQGPSGYVSPNWYTTPAQSVPTWNYVAVHLRGTLQRIDTADGKRAIVDALSARHESRLENPWTSDKMSPALLDKMLDAIVGFQLTVTGVDAKFKLSQNRGAADRAGVVQALEASGDAPSLALAGWMRPYSTR